MPVGLWFYGGEGAFRKPNDRGRWVKALYSPNYLGVLDYGTGIRPTYQLTPETAVKPGEGHVLHCGGCNLEISKDINRPDLYMLFSRTMFDVEKPFAPRMTHRERYSSQKNVIVNSTFVTDQPPVSDVYGYANYPNGSLTLKGYTWGKRVIKKDGRGKFVDKTIQE